MRPADDLPRAQRNALADVIIAALRDREAHAALAGLARVLGAPRPVMLDAGVAARLRAHGIVIDATDGDAAARAGMRSHGEVVLAPAFARARDAVAARVHAACVAADQYWRHTAASRHDARARHAPAHRAGGRRAADADDERAAALRRAAALFGAALYFEVHEELEPLWRRARGAARVALQGLIQIAVALHHAERGNLAGARRLVAAGRAKVEPYAPVWEGVAIDLLLADLRRWEHARLDDRRVAAPPRLVLA